MSEPTSPTLPWWRRLVVQLVVLVLVVMTLPLLALGISNVQTARSQALQQAQLTNLAWAEVVADRIAFHISEVVAELTVLADSPPLRAGDWTAARAELERRQAQRPDLTTLTLTDAEGNERVKVSVTELVLPESLGSRAQTSDFLAVTQGKTYLGNVHLVPGAGQRLLVAVPVFDAARQQVVGVLSAELSLRDLLDAVGAMRVGRGGYAYVVDGAGRVIAHPDFSLVLAQADASGLPEVQDFLAGMVERQEPEFSSYPSLAGQPVFGVHAMAEPLGWGIVVEQPAAEVLAPVRALTARLSALLGLTVLLSAGLVLFLTDLLARPISQLTQAAQHLATGNLSIRAPAGGRNEVGLLAVTFNQMAGSIQQAQTEMAASEARYRALVDWADDVIFSLDRDGRYTAVNASTLRRFGWTEADFVGKSIYDLYPSEEAAFYEAQHARVFETGQPAHFERHSVNELGEFWFSITLSPIFDPAGQVVGISGISRDITARKQAEEALRRRAAELEALAEVSSALRVARTVEEMLSIILDKTLEVVGAQTGLLALLEAGREVVVRVARGPEVARPGARFPLETLPAVCSVHTPTVCTESHDCPLCGPARGRICFSLQTGEASSRGSARGAVVGLMAVEPRTAGALGPHETRLLIAIADMAASAIRRASLFEELQGRVRELLTLYESSKAISQLVAVEEFPQRVIEVMERLLDYEHGAVLLIDEQTGELVPFALSDKGKGREFVERDKEYVRSRGVRVGVGITGWVAQTGQVVRTGDVRQDPRYLAMRPDIRSELCAPLKIGERIIGVMNIETSKPDAYTEHDERLLVTLAGQIATAIENTRLYAELKRHSEHLEQMVDQRTEELRRRSDELATLYETSLSITLAADLEVVLDRVAEAACSVAQADSASILLYDERLDRFTVSATSGWGNDLVRGQHQPVRPDDIARRMLREREPIIAADVLDDPDIQPMVLDSGARSLLAVPVEQQQRLLGVLYVNAQAPGAFDTHHLTVMHLFANQAAVAIENARLLQRQQVETMRLRSLNELMVGIVGAHALDRTLDAIAQAIVDLLGCDMAAVGLYDPASDEIRIPVEYGYRGFSRAFVEQFHVPAGSGAGGKAFAEGRVVVIPDTRSEGVVIDHAQAERAGIRAMLVGPLQTPEHKLGVLYANQRRPYSFSEDEVGLFSILAGQAAVAIENVRLYEGLQARSRELAASLEELEATNTDMLKVLEDLTKARAELEERAALLEEAKEQAEEADRLKTAFLATVSHELRTPLASIKGFATTLLADDVTWDADSQHDFLQTIDQEADRLTELISQLLDMSRLEAGTLRIERERCYLADILTRIEERLGVLTARHQLGLEVAPDLPALNVDPGRIGNVLTNLVENAAKFAPAGTKITVTARAKDGQVVVSVADEGPGIAPEHQVHLFERFYRVDSEITRSRPGTGLGLAICKGLVEAHGGRIWVESEPGQGATLFFSLPAA